jgi:hypothetical protein
MLADFFVGRIGAGELASELRCSEQQIDAIKRCVTIEDMKTDFLVTRDMAPRVCDCALRGELGPEELRLAGCVIVTSDRFTWGDDDLLAEVLTDWSCPDVNYPLTDEYLRLFRSWLDGSATYPVKPR